MRIRGAQHHDQSADRERFRNRRLRGRHPNDPSEAPTSDHAPIGTATRRLGKIERAATAVGAIAAGVSEGLGHLRARSSPREAKRSASEARPHEETAEASSPYPDSTHAAHSDQRHGPGAAVAYAHEDESAVDRIRAGLRESAFAVRAKASDVRQAARQSRGAGTEFVEHLKGATRASARSKGLTVGGYTVAGVAAIIMLVLLSAGSVVAFNMLLGAPWGYFVTAGIYALVGAIAVVGSRVGAHGQDDHAHDEMESARETVRAVVQPLRRPVHNGDRHAPAGDGRRARRSVDRVASA